MRVGYDVIKFCRNRVRRTYRGGLLLDRWTRHPDAHDSDSPEEWMASTVLAANQNMTEVPGEGLSVEQCSGRTLRDLIAENPKMLLGAGHAQRYGASMGVLLKGLDSAERLNIQVHPDKTTAKRLFRSDFGKTEAWYILNVRELADATPVIYAGFQDGVMLEDWRKLFWEQDRKAILGCLREIPVRPGDVFLIKGGVPHAIGAGCLIAEIQEPTDLTIRMERVTDSGLHLPDVMCHQGIGFEKMFECFSFDTRDSEPRLVPRITRKESDFSVTTLIAYEDTPAFAMELIEVRGVCRLASEGRFFVVIALEGEGVLESENKVTPMRQGEYALVPAACAELTVKTSKHLKILRCLPPRM